MKKNSRLCILIIINVFITLYAGAYTISGNLPGHVISDIVVTLSGDASAVTVTDENGNYEFTNLPEGGTYTITPSKSYTPPDVFIINPGANDSVIGDITIDLNLRTDYCGYGFLPMDITIVSLDKDYSDQDFQMALTACCFMITNVETYIDDILVDVQSTDIMCQGTFSYSLDTTQFENGQHTIGIIVYDENGGTASRQIPVTINNNTEPLLGDVNIDGEVGIIDALLTAQYYVGNTPEIFDTPLGDVNLDNSVTIIDALLIAQYYVGLLSEIPENIPGGYSRISTANDYTIAAYTFLQSHLAEYYPAITSGAVKLAFSQIVSGMNVKLIVSYYSTETGANHYLAAVIYFNLDMIPEHIQSLDFNILSR